MKIINSFNFHFYFLHYFIKPGKEENVEFTR